ncbi:MAG: MFS transporter small subunit [Rubrobacteraceae bacterium]
MTTQRQQGSEGPSSASWALVAVFWALVLIPLAWGVYRTLTSVVALFAGG